MYGCAITCSETSSSLGVSQTGLSSGAGATVLALRHALGGLDRLTSLRSWSSVMISIRRPACLPAHSRPRASTGSSTTRRAAATHCILLPRVAVSLPGLGEPIAAQIGADLRQRRRDLDPAVRQHEQASPAGSSRLARSPSRDVERIDSRAPSRLRAGARRARAGRGIRAHSASLGSSRSHSRAAVPMRISLPVLKRNAPSERARSITASASWMLRRVGANVISSGMPAARTARHAACAAASEPPTRWRA